MDHRAGAPAAEKLISLVDELRGQAQARHESLRNHTPDHPGPTPNDYRPRRMRPADATLLTTARHDVDLPGFLANAGFEPVRDKDTRRHRILAGPAGQKVRVTRAASGDWVWADLHGAGGGNIYHACTQLLGLTHGQAMGRLRKTVAAPPPALPSGRSGSATAVRPPRILATLKESGRRYLIGDRHLDPASLDAFSHAMRQHSLGVVYPHNRHGDGEERGPEWRSFYGSRDDGEGRGRSLWVAMPHGSRETPTHVIVAESGTDAISAWEMVPDDLKPTTAIISTAGVASEAGREKLERVLAQMVQHYGAGVPILVDVSDVGERGTEARTAWLRGLADSMGLLYERVVPTQEGVKDWNEELGRVKAAQRAQGAAALLPTMEADQPDPEPPDEPKTGVRGRGGGRR